VFHDGVFTAGGLHCLPAAQRTPVKEMGEGEWGGGLQLGDFPRPSVRNRRGGEFAVTTMGEYMSLVGNHE
jgi:hypothetical protein